MNILNDKQEKTLLSDDERIHGSQQVAVYILTILVYAIVHALQIDHNLFPLQRKTAISIFPIDYKRYLP